MDQQNGSMLRLPTSYVAYDLETSDFYSRGEIVEFGAVRVEDGQVTGEFSELCALRGRMNWHVSKANHITDAMLVGRRPVEEVFADFCLFVGMFPLVGFNNHGFDDRFIVREAGRRGLRCPVENGSYDVRRLHGRGTLARCCEEYGIVNEDAHRALSDAYATYLVYEAVRRERLGL